MAEGPLSVIVELPCVGCGYNLRMAPAAGKCPECGAAVEQSLQETALKWGAKYLRRVARGVFWAALLAMAMPVTYIGMGLLSELLRFVLPGDPEEYFSLMRWYRLAMAAVFAALALAFTLAVWLATGAPQGQRVGWRGWLIRAGTASFWASILLVVAQALVELLSQAWMLDETFLGLELRYLVLVYPVLFMGLSLAAWPSAACMAQIDRAGGNAARTGFGKWSLRTFACGFAFLMVVFFTMLMLDLFDVGRIVMRAIETAVAACALTDAGLTLVAFILTVIGLILFSRRVRRMALLAEAAGGVFVGPMDTGTVNSGEGLSGVQDAHQA